ncbi:hypothetical protein Bca52824_000387 [Brassica carinata]|uniref:Uncharacterized protein n=1 Tax=Brassica carinata TaxID=52824 RepID=A0A8X7WH29_BRACI|nr:hypothetical protein Bca52824_000387 [Brassica carinata]
MWIMLIKRNQVGNSRFRLHSQNPDGYKIGSQLATAKYPVCAGGLRKVLKYIKENYKYPEMIVTGNGYRETPGEKDGGNDYPGDDMSGAQSVTEKLSNVAQNGVPVTAPPLQGQSVEDVSSVEDRA